MKTSNKIIVIYVTCLVASAVVLFVLNYRECKKAEPLARELLAGFASQRFRVVEYEGPTTNFQLATRENRTGVFLSTGFTPSPENISFRGDTVFIRGECSFFGLLIYEPEVYVNGDPYAVEVYQP